MTRTRILYSSNAPWSASGYGSQGRSLTQRLAELPEIGGRENLGIVAWYGLSGGIHHWNGFTIFPAGNDPYGNDVIGPYAKRFGAGIVFTLIDAWVNRDTAKSIYPALYCPWFPVDHEPIPQRVIDGIAGAHMPLTYSKWGRDMCLKAGINNTYIPHGVEPSIFRVIPRENALAFKRAVTGVDNAHLSIMVAANKGFPDRKWFQGQLRAWAEFAKDKPNAYLYIHTEPTQIYGGVDFGWLLGHLGIADRVRFPDRLENFLGLPQEYLALVYNAADVLLSCSMSEGFGIPIVEAQACFPSGVLVNTGEGHKPIEDVQRGEYVVTHTGARKRVYNTMKRQYAGEMMTLNIYGDEPIRCTPEHPWLVFRNDERVFVSAGDIQAGDWVCLPKTNPANESTIVAMDSYARSGANQFGSKFAHPTARTISDISVDRGVASLFGYYISEGCASETKGIRFSFHANETDYHDTVRHELSRLGIDAKVRIDHNTAVIDSYSAQLARMLREQFGDSCYTKRIPAWASNLPLMDALGLLQGIWNGDGCFYLDREKYARASYSTVSKALAYDLKVLLLRFGISSNVSLTNAGTAYQVRVTGPQVWLLAELLDENVFDGRKQDKQWYRFDEDYCYAQVRDVSVAYVEDEEVYNLSVENDESYTVNGFAVHNCGTPVVVTDFSAMPELVRWGHTVKVADYVLTPMNAYQAWPDVVDMTDKLQRLYEAWDACGGDWPLEKRIATQDAIHAEYSWDVIVRDQWAPLMTRLADEAPPLDARFQAQGVSLPTAHVDDAQEFVGVLQDEMAKASKPKRRVAPLPSKAVVP